MLIVGLNLRAVFSIPAVFSKGACTSVTGGIAVRLSFGAMIQIDSSDLIITESRKRVLKTQWHGTHIL